MILNPIFTQIVKNCIIGNNYKERCYPIKYEISSTTLQIILIFKFVVNEL